MVAQRLSTWGALRPISSMNAKSTASRRGDCWVASPPPPATAAATKDSDHHQRRGRRALVHGPPPPFLLLPRHVIATEKESSAPTLADQSGELIDWLMVFLEFKKQACFPNGYVLSTLRAAAAAASLTPRASETGMIPSQSPV